MTYTVVPTITTGDVATAAWGNTHIKDNFAHILTAGGLLLHERGGMELDISGVADGGMMVGTGSGVWAIRAAAFTAGAAGFLKHEAGGLEFSPAAVADGGVIVGTGAGTMALRAGFLTAGAAGYVKHELGGLEFNAAGVTAGELVYGSGTGTMALLAIGTGLQVLRVNSGATGLEWATLSVPLAKHKRASETINNTTTIQNDDELVIAVAANTDYIMSMVLYFLSATTAVAGIDWAFSLPSGAAGAATDVSNDSSGDANALTNIVTERIAAQENSTVLGAYHYVGHITVGETAGNAQLQWAQNTGVAENTTLIAGSSLMLTPEA